jgi:probable F420-dependent oxidoreductase
MDIGVFIFATDYTIRLDELAPALEERGFASLYVPEHTHIPTSRISPFPGGGDLPKEYSHTFDPFVSLSFAAAKTSKLRLGTGICLVPQHEPIATANAIASLDLMSDGRFYFGIGGGWNVEEMNNHGVDYKTRFKQMREHILAMKSLWTEDESSYHGEFVDFDTIWSYPKPARKPHPPIILGGETDYTLSRVAEYCDGWMPRVGPNFEPAAEMARLKKFVDEAGRDMSEMWVSAFRAPTDRGGLDALAEAGVSEGLLRLPSDDRDTVLGLLDEYAKLIN